MPKVIDVKIVSAFTKDNKGGNLAGVARCHNLTNEEKQKVAKVLNLSETVFIDESDGYSFRYFTPVSEIDFCGHATLAALNTLNISNTTIKTNNFNIDVVKKNKVYFSSDKPKIKDVKLDEEEILDSLGITKDDTELPMSVVYSGVDDIFISIKDIKTLRNINPDLKTIKRLSEKYNVIGYHLYTLDSKYTATTRNFAPLFGIDEESATGSANSALAFYLQSQGIKEDEYVFLQGENLNEESLINVTINDDLVYISGEATILEERTIKLYGGKESDIKA